MKRPGLFSFPTLAALCILSILHGCVVYVPQSRYAPAPPPTVAVAPLPCPAGYGWSPGYGCVPVPVSPPPVYAPVITRVKSATLNLRACPGTSCAATATLVKGEEVQVLGYGDGWTRVYVPARALEGWVSGRHLSDY
ncbi:MAG: SH3 domain-containing protein [Desulfovibrionaceae bacterium]|nr:SH3 domain-containing protein [Desulfovibrionaceae bacterium]